MLTIAMAMAVLAKVHWNPKKLETFPSATVPGTLHDLRGTMPSAGSRATRS